MIINERTDSSITELINQATTRMPSHKSTVVDVDKMNMRAQHLGFPTAKGFTSYPVGAQDPEEEQQHEKLLKRSLSDASDRAVKRSMQPKHAVLPLLADLEKEHGELEDEYQKIIEISKDLVRPHTKGVWELYDSGEEVPFLCGLHPPNDEVDEQCCQRLWHDSDHGERTCTRNSSAEWGYMKEDAWTCATCYHTEDTLRGCSKQICPNYNELGRCDRCRPSAPW